MKKVFKDAKVGDKVWSSLYGIGTLISIDTDKQQNYPLNVSFSTKNRDNYTLEGHRIVGSEYPELYWKEPAEKYKVTEKPSPEVDWTKVPIDTDVIVSAKLNKNNKRKLALYLPAMNNFLCFPEGKNKHTAATTFIWSKCKLAPHVKVKKKWLKVKEK